MDRPSPVPSPTGFVVKNGLNIFSLTSSGMPVPLSRILISTLSPRFFHSRIGPAGPMTQNRELFDATPTRPHSKGGPMSVPATDSIESTRPLLFQPFKVRGLMLTNRLVVPPMVHYRAGPGSTCDMFHNVHLGRYALGGFGLVFVEATAVEEIGLINENDLGIWNDAQVQSFKPLIAFMKGENTAIGIQLAHGGRKSSSQRAMDGMGPLTPQEIEAGAKMWQPVGPTSEPVANG